jgi:hypothetical protein
MRKGMTHIIEAAIAGMVLVAFLSVLYPVSRPPAALPDAGSRGFAELRALDVQGLLRDRVSMRDAGGLDSLVGIFGYNHTVQICCSSGCTGAAPQAGNVWAATYLVAGNDAPDPCSVNLYLW